MSKKYGHPNTKRYCKQCRWEWKSTPRRPYRCPRCHSSLWYLNRRIYIEKKEKETHENC